MTVIVDKTILVKLRKTTFAGFSECKKALEATNNSFDEAITWLRKNGISKAASKFGSKTTTEGKVVVKKNNEGAMVLELSCETDFTANSEPFVKLSNLIGEKILISKTENLVEILELKIDDLSTIKESMLTLSSITGEKIELKKVCYMPIAANQSIAFYQHHNNKIGSLILLNKTLKEDLIKGLAVHLVANNSRFLSPEFVEKAWLENEKSIILDSLKKDPKPEHLYEIILEKKIQKVIDESCFITQPYLYDSKKTVQEYLKGLGAEAIKIVCFEISK